MMSKELEALKSLGEHHCSLMQKYESKECSIPCHECKYLKEEEIIKKELKALEIIKAKQVNVRRAIILRENYEDYLEKYGELFAHCESILTQEEYELLKEVLL